MSAVTISAAPRQLGRTAIKVSPLGFGLWRFVGEDAVSARGKIETALAAGITFFDTAAVYGLDWGGRAFGESEVLLGRVLKDAPHLRDAMVLASKCGITPGIPYDSSKDAIIESCHASLKRLNAECIDLFQLHRPDVLTHPAEAAEALAALHAAGKIRAAGVSNYTPAQTRALMAHLSLPLASTQPEVSALNIDAIDDGTLDLAMEAGLTPLAWSPLAGGRLMSAKGQDERTQAVMEALDQLAAELGTGRDTAAHAFVLAHPARPVALIGSQTPARFAAAQKALGLRITRAAWYRVFASARGRPLP